MFRNVLNLTSSFFYLLRVLWLIGSKTITRVKSALQFSPTHVFALNKNGKADNSHTVTKISDNEVAIKNQRSPLRCVTERRSNLYYRVPCTAPVHCPFPSASEYRMSQLSAEQGDALAAQKRFQKKAFEFISKALELDEGTTGMGFRVSFILDKNYRILSHWNND